MLKTSNINEIKYILDLNSDLNNIILDEHTYPLNVGNVLI